VCAETLEELLATGENQDLHPLCSMREDVEHQPHPVVVGKHQRIVQDHGGRRSLVNQHIGESEAHENRNLLLSKRARSDSIPILEIDNDDVRCTHGSATGQVDQEELFYVMAHGLDKNDAARMLVEGFFSEVNQHTPLDGVQAQLAGKVQEKMTGWQVED